MNHRKKQDNQNTFHPPNTERLVKEYALNYPNPLDLCIQGLKYDISKRDMNIVSIINPYLLSLPSFVQVLRTETTSKNFEDIVTKISLVMSHRKILKNRLIMRLGDKGNEFFIILNGKVGFMVVKNIKCYLNEEEFIMFLLKLRKNNELELLRINILNNIQCFDIKEDFDKWLKDIVYANKRNGNHHKRFSDELYTKMEQLQTHIEFFNNAYKSSSSSPSQDHLTNLTVTPPIYIKLNNIDNANLDPKERKLACISIYQHMNSFTSGQNFGYIALESKNCKRTASVITLEDCDFGILTKEDYQKLIKEVNEKARKRLYNLVYLYPLFQSVAKGIFEYKYMHMFHYVKYKSGERIMNEGEHVSTIIFIKNGEFELTIHKNIIEVNELIINLKKLKKQLQQQTYCPNENDCNYSYEQKENEDFVLNEQFKSIEFKEMVNKRLPIKVSIVKDRDVLGLYDTVLEQNGMSLYNCTCLSTCGEGYQIEMESLLNIAQKEERVLTEAKRFSIKKITCFIERLNKHKEAVFNKIKETENINKQLHSDNYNKHRNNSKNRFIDLERNSKYKHDQLLYNSNNNKKTIIHNLSLEKQHYNMKPKRRNLMLSPITDVRMHKHKKKIKIAPLNTHTEKHYEKEVYQKMRRLEQLQEDQPHNKQLLYTTRTNVSPNSNSSNNDTNGFKWNNKLNQSLALMKQIKEVKTMRDSYSGILSTYVTTKKSFNNTRSRNKIHSYTNSELQSLQVNKTESRLLPTIYRNTTNTNTNSRANVNVIDCLILDKFNTLYKRGLIKK
jgi:CRP-like cAMP-binding protein